VRLPYDGFQAVEMQQRPLKKLTRPIPTIGFRIGPRYNSMKTSCGLLCLAILPVSAISFAQDLPKSSTNLGNKETQIINLEKASWEAYKNKEADAFKTYLAPEYRGVYGSGIQTADVDAAEMSTTDLRSYSFSDEKVEFPNAEVAVITYKAVMDMTIKQKDVSGTYHCASVWVKKGAKWLTVVHTEIKAQEPQS
jgi:hypothetical protein